MKIAVPVTSDNQIDGHFGHCESYDIFTISDSRKITEVKSVEPPRGCGCKSDIASTLSTDGVSVLLAAGIGEGAVNKLNNYGIEVIRGCSGNATEVVELFISGLVEDTASSCNHHEKHNAQQNNVEGRELAHNCSHEHPHNHNHEHSDNCGCNGHHGHEHAHTHTNAHNCECN